MKNYLLLSMAGLFILFNNPSVAQLEKKTTNTSPVIGKTKASRLLSETHTKKKLHTTKNNTNLHGQLNLTSNYVFRGISQTKNYPAAQGGLSYSEPETGLYIGAWGSNASFVDDDEHTAIIEIDPSIGISKQFGKDIKYDASVTYYYYPGVISSSYPEFNAYLNYHFINTHFAYSNNVYALGKSGTYYNVGFNHVIPSKYFFNMNDVSLLATIGYSHLPKNMGLLSYQDYSVTLRKIINDFSCSIQWTDTVGGSVDKPAFKNNLFAIMLGRSF